MTAHTARTKKAKGTRLEVKVAERYRHYEIDDTARRMPLSGAMSHFKSDIYKRFDVNWVDECKAHETINLRRFWDQTAAQAGLRSPVLHISANYRPIITVITESDFEALVNEDMRRFVTVDITSKKRWNFWEYAALCTDFVPTATIVYCAVPDESLVLMTVDVYCKLRKENL